MVNFEDENTCKLIDKKVEKFNKHSQYSKTYETYEIYKKLDDKNTIDIEGITKEANCKEIIKRTLTYTNLYNNLPKYQRDKVQDRVYWDKFGDKDINNKLSNVVNGDIYFKFNYNLINSKSAKKYIYEQIKNYLNDEPYEKILVDIPYVKTFSHQSQEKDLDDNWDKSEVNKKLVYSSYDDDWNKFTPLLSNKSLLVQTNNFPNECNTFIGENPKYKVIELFNNLINIVMNGKSSFLDRHNIREALLIIECDDDKNMKAESMGNKLLEFNKKLKERINSGSINSGNLKNKLNDTQVNSSGKKVFVPLCMRSNDETDKPKFINVKDSNSNNIKQDSNVNKKCIRISNLPDEIEREELEDWLRQYRSKGLIRFKLNTFVDRNKMNKSNDSYSDDEDDEVVKIQYIRNYAFLEFRVVSDCEKAFVLLERQTFFNVVICVEYANQRKPRN